MKNIIIIKQIIQLYVVSIINNKIDAKSIIKKGFNIKPILILIKIAIK